MAFEKVVKRRFNLVFNDEEMEQLQELATRMQRSKNGALKMLIRYGHGYFIKKENMPKREMEVS